MRAYTNGLTHELTYDSVEVPSSITSAALRCADEPYAITRRLSWYGSQAIVNVVAMVMHILVTLRAACCCAVPTLP